VGDPEYPLHRVLAIEAAIRGTEARASLDVAWREAAAAADALFNGPTYIALAGPEPWRGSLSYRAECGINFAVRGHPTPEAALLALRAILAEADR
jgi:hypothetical protein